MVACANDSGQSPVGIVTPKPTIIADYNLYWTLILTYRHVTDTLELPGSVETMISTNSSESVPNLVRKA